MFDWPNFQQFCMIGMYWIVDEQDWFNGTAAGTWCSMGVFSDGSYGTAEGVMFRYPGLAVTDLASCPASLSLSPTASGPLSRDWLSQTLLRESWLIQVTTLLLFLFSYSSYLCCDSYRCSFFYLCCDFLCYSYQGLAKRLKQNSNCKPYAECFGSNSG